MDEKISGSIAHKAHEDSPFPVFMADSILHEKKSSLDIKEFINIGFEPYFTTKKKGSGSGLGLSVVYGIVKECGGAIWIDSAPGKGTTVNIYFPTVGSELKSDTPKIVSNSSKTDTVLFVDDEELIVETGRLLLEHLGYDVKSTTCPVEAFDFFKSSPDWASLVITDLSMPQMSGDELISKILLIRPAMPIIICTGKSNINSETDPETVGASAILRKPFKKIDME